AAVPGAGRRSDSDGGDADRARLARRGHDPHLHGRPAPAHLHDCAGEAARGRLLEPSESGHRAHPRRSRAMTRDYRFRRFAAALAFVLAFPWSASAESHHYSMTARIRPLYLFWISRSGVGDAVVTRDESREDARYSLLIGSDP